MQGSNTQLPDVIPGYDDFLKGLKKRIRSAQARAVLSANRELIQLYWEIGRQIVEQQLAQGWGRSIVKKLSKDLCTEFPDISGFSARNLWDMRRFYARYHDRPKLRQLVADLPWGHNLLILNALKDLSLCEWYIWQTIENGWSRAVLAHQIATKLYERQVKAVKVANFASVLPPSQSELVQQTLKDPYVFDFLEQNEPSKERDLEREIIRRLRDFMLELGAGFAFMGSQYHIEIEEEDFYIDLLFYHHRL